MYLAVCAVTDELSSSGDSKADDDPDKKSPKDKDVKDRERDREEGLLLRSFDVDTCITFYKICKENFPFIAQNGNWCACAQLVLGSSFQMQCNATCFQS